MTIFVTDRDIKLFKFIKSNQPANIDTIRSSFPWFNEATGAEYRNHNYLKSPPRKDSQFLIYEEIYSLDNGAIKALADYESRQKAACLNKVSFWISIAAAIVSVIALFK